MISKNKSTIQSLQVLRGIACLIVMLFHTNESLRIYSGRTFLFNLFKSGNAGVDLFFVLSGFIIVYSTAGQTPSLQTAGRFWWNRLIRIFPVYWLCVSGFLLLQIALPQYYPTPFPRTAANLLETYLLLPGHTSLNGVSWTLTYELLFYAVFCVTLLVGSLRIKLWICAVVLVACFLGAFFPGTLMTKFTRLIFFPLNMEFLLGVLAARCFRSVAVKPAKLIAATGILAFVLSSIFHSPHQSIWDPGMDSTILFGIPSFMIILGLAAVEHNRKINYSHLLSRIGDASYSLYLIHVPFIAATIRLLPVSRMSSLLINSLLILLLVLLTGGVIFFYKWIEQPMLNWLKERTPAYFRRPLPVHSVSAKN